MPAAAATRLPLGRSCLHERWFVRKAWWTRWLVAAAGFVLPCASAAAAEPPPEFDKDVRPMLEDACFRCHGAEKQEAGLRLDVKAEALKASEGDKRAAVVPGDALKSTVLQHASNGHAGAPILPAEDLERIRRWIETGAHWTDPEAAAPKQEETPSRRITDADKQWWSFIAPKTTPLDSLAVPDA